jgi:hypothetical protein
MLLTLSATLVWAAPNATQLLLGRSGYDPLSADEITLARTLAFQNTTFAQHLQAASQTELLLIERHQETKAVMQSGNWPRRADVLVYAYGSETLVQAVVNLATRRVDFVTTTQNVQPPLNAAETDRAFDLVMATPALQAEIKAQYQTITGQTLTRPKQQLKIEALIFRADSMPTAPLGAAVECGRHRCAQLLLTTQDNLLINVLPIVDLSQGLVAVANPFVEN